MPVVLEVLGWDEAFVGAGEGHGDLGDPWELATVVRTAVLERTRLHCSVGIGNNKLQAKIATDFGKPRGDLRDHRRDLVRRDGRPPDPGAVGRRVQDRRAGWRPSGSRR